MFKPEIFKVSILKLALNRNYMNLTSEADSKAKQTSHFVLLVLNCVDFLNGVTIQRCFELEKLKVNRVKARDSKKYR